MPSEKQIVKQKFIYSLGTSNRAPEEFIHLLTIFSIQNLIDVRRFPTSKFEHFQKRSLEGLLKKRDIGYLYLGNQLGGYRRGGYESYTETEEFKEGLGRLKDIAKEKKAAMVCSERFPWRCHRRFIAQRLKEEGWEVVHIIDENRTWEGK